MLLTAIGLLLDSVLLVLILLIDDLTLGRSEVGLVSGGVSKGRGGLVIVHPLDVQVRIVLAQIVVVQRLLGEEGRYDVLESNQGESLRGLNYYFLDLAEDFEHLQNQNRLIYTFDV